MATAHMNVKGRTSLDGSGWAAGLRKMETGTKAAAGRMASSMAGAIGGVFAVGFLTSATRRILQHADQIDKTAKRISTSTDTVQKFDFAATQSGAALTDVEKAFINTSKAIEGAKQGLTTQMRAFQAFGISLQMLQTMSPEQVFLKIAEAIEKAGGALDKAKSLTDIMGRGGSTLIPAFAGGFAGLMDDAPKGIEAETIKKLAEFNDELDRLKRTALPAAANVVGLLADIFDYAGSPRNPDELNFLEKQIAAQSFMFSGQAGSERLDSDVLAQRRMGIDIRQSEWDDISKNFGKALARPEMANFLEGINPFVGRGTKAQSAGAGNWVKDAVEAQSKDATTTGFMKPSLALNALQRIGAAVSQSADPIAIEKDNNILLKRIATNTKDIARNSE